MRATRVASFNHVEVVVPAAGSDFSDGIVELDGTSLAVADDSRFLVRGVAAAFAHLRRIEAAPQSGGLARCRFELELGRFRAPRRCPQSHEPLRFWSRFSSQTQIANITPTTPTNKKKDSAIFHRELSLDSFYMPTSHH